MANPQVSRLLRWDLWRFCPHLFVPHLSISYSTSYREVFLFFSFLVYFPGPPLSSGVLGLFPGLETSRGLHRLVNEKHWPAEVSTSGRAVSLCVQLSPCLGPHLCFVCCSSGSPPLLPVHPPVFLFAPSLVIEMGLPKPVL